MGADANSARETNIKAFPHRFFETVNTESSTASVTTHFQFNDERSKEYLAQFNTVR